MRKEKKRRREDVVYIVIDVTGKYGGRVERRKRQTCAVRGGGG